MALRSVVAKHYHFELAQKLAGMQLLYLIPLLTAGVNAHGVLLQVNGANGVIAPGACGKFTRMDVLYIFNTNHFNRYIQFWIKHPATASSMLAVRRQTPVLSVMRR